MTNTNAATVPGPPSREVNVNDVHVIGRVSARPEERILPSGDTVCSWRVVVRRPAEHPSKQRVDVFDCAAWDEPTRATAMSWVQGDVVEIEGAVRRRFFRQGEGARSRVEIEVRVGRVIHHVESG